MHSGKKSAKSGLDWNTCHDWNPAVIIQKVLCREIDKTKHNYSFCSVWNKAPLQSPHVIQFVSLAAFVFCPNIQINHLPSNLKKWKSPKSRTWQIFLLAFHSQDKFSKSQCENQIHSAKLCEMGCTKCAATNQSHCKYLYVCSSGKCSVALHFTHIH